MKPLITIGRAENINLPALNIRGVPARIDTGAKTSAIWASEIVEQNGKLSFVLFGKGHKLFTGEKLFFDNFKLVMVASSTGEVQERYKVQLLVELAGRKIRASFTLADRSTQVYPVLVGRNVLSGKFLINPKLGKPLVEEEKNREKTKKEQLKNFKQED